MAKIEESPFAWNQVLLGEFRATMFGPGGPRLWAKMAYAGDDGIHYGGVAFSAFSERSEKLWMALKASLEEDLVARLREPMELTPEDEKQVEQWMRQIEAKGSFGPDDAESADPFGGDLNDGSAFQ